LADDKSLNDFCERLVWKRCDGRCLTGVCGWNACEKRNSNEGLVFAVRLTRNVFLVEPNGLFVLIDAIFERFITFSRSRKCFELFSDEIEDYTKTETFKLEHYCFSSSAFRIWIKYWVNMLGILVFVGISVCYCRLENRLSICSWNLFHLEGGIETRR